MDVRIINRENSTQAAAEHCHVIAPSFYEQWEDCKSSDFQMRAFTFFLMRLKRQIFWKRCNWKEPSSVQQSRGIFSGGVIESGAAFQRTSSTSLVWLLMKVSPLNSYEEGFFFSGGKIGREGTLGCQSRESRGGNVLSLFYPLFQSLLFYVIFRSRFHSVQAFIAEH